MSMRFDNKTVVVSGAAGGIGDAIAREFASLGATVFACDRRQDRLAELEAAGVAVETVDLTDRGAAAAWIAGIETRRGGAVDVLVNNSGGVAGQTGRALEEVSDADWDEVMAINLGAAFALSRACVPGMKRARRGCIVNITSGAATNPSLTGIQSYCATKHAVVGLTEALRSELRGTGIELHQVLPIGVNTELYSGVSAARGFPTAEPQDVADTIVELLQTGKFELYVPRKVAAITRMQALMPRRVAEAIIRFTKGDQLLLAADPAARAAYEARITGSAPAPEQERTAA